MSNLVASRATNEPSEAAFLSLSDGRAELGSYEQAEPNSAHFHP
jgi:hypothetical protein